MRDDFRIGFVVIGFMVCVPFAIWKWIEIIIWFIKHISITFK